MSVGGSLASTLEWDLRPGEHPVYQRVILHVDKPVGERVRVGEGSASGEHPVKAHSKKDQEGGMVGHNGLDLHPAGLSWRFKFRRRFADEEYT